MKRFKPIDRLFLISSLILFFLMGLVLARGDHTYPQVVEISPEAEEIALGTRQIVLTFNRNMDHDSVEEGFLTTPPLPGRFSWIGKKMAYSFDEALEPGQTLTIEIQGAKDGLGNPMENDFEKVYRVLDQVIYFIDEDNQLVSYEPKIDQLTVLTDPQMHVKRFELSPDNKAVFFINELAGKNKGKADLFRLDLSNDQVEKLIDGTEEYVFTFAIAPHSGQLFIRKGWVSQVGQQPFKIGPSESWLYDLNQQEWTEFWNQDIAGQSVIFSADSNYLIARLVSSEIGVIPINEELGDPIYLDSYLGSFDLSPQGNKMVFVDFEGSFQPHELILRNNEGENEVLISNIGQIQFPTFSQDGNRVYFLMNELVDTLEGGKNPVSPYHLYEYNLNEKSLSPITSSTDYFEGSFKLSSDGKKIVFERYKSSEEGLFFESQLKAEAQGAEIWMYDIASKTLTDTKLRGFKPSLN